MARFDVVGLGAMNMDNIFLVPEIVEDNEVVATLAGKFPGGSAANSIYALGRIGLEVGFVGAIGKDIDGRRLTRDLLRAGVDTTRLKTIPAIKTGASICLSDRRGNRSIYLLPGANDHLYLDKDDLNYINQARLVHISSFVGPVQWLEVLKAVANLGPQARLTFSPGTIYARKSMGDLATILKRTDVLFLSSRELSQLTGKEIEEGARELCDQGCRMVVVTLGSGRTIGQTRAVAYTLSQEGKHLTEAIEEPYPLDTTGAGDAFTAGFLFGLISDQDVLHCGRLGALVASFSVRKLGPREGLPTREDLKKYYLKVYGEQL